MRTVDRAALALAATLFVLLASASAAQAATGRAYVLRSVDADTDAVAIVDVATRALVRSIPLSAKGSEIVVSPDGTRAYVAHGSGDRVSVIDISSDTVVATVEVSHNPQGISISPDGTRLYVASLSGVGVEVVDTATNTRLPGSFPYLNTLLDVQVSPDGTTLYWVENNSISSARPGAIAVANAMTGAVQRRITVPDPKAIHLTPDGTRMYVSTTFPAGSYWVIDLTANPPAVSASPISAGSIAISPDSTRLYDAKPGVLDFRAIASGASLGTAVIGATPKGIGVTPDGTRVVVTNEAEGTVSLVDTADRTNAGAVAVGAKPYAVAIGPGPEAPVDPPPPPPPPPPPSADPGASPPAPPPPPPPVAPLIGGSSTVTAPRPQQCVSTTMFAGTPAADVRDGTASGDVMIGLGGADRLSGRGGRDCLYGENGNDRLSGDAGGDFLFGGSGADKLTGGSGDDRLEGDAGGDTIAGGLGSDRLGGGGGADRMNDDRGRDAFAGDAGDDRIDARDATRSGRRGIDDVQCGAGRDIVLADRTDRVAPDCERVSRRRA